MQFFTGSATTMIMDVLRDEFSAGRMSEWEFRKKLRQRGYTDHGADREIESLKPGSVPQSALANRR